MNWANEVQRCKHTAGGGVLPNDVRMRPLAGAIERKDRDLASQLEAPSTALR